MAQTRETQTITQAGPLSRAAMRRASLTPEERQFGEELRQLITTRQRLRELRLSLRLTQAQAGEIAGEDQGDISRLERGLGNPTAARLERIIGRLLVYAEAQRETSPAPAAPARSRRAIIPAQTAAAYLCAVRDEEDSFTNLKLQKLLYYAQAFSLVRLGRPLFPERIKAWPHGPVVPQVRYEYKVHQAQPLPRPEQFDVLAVDPQARMVLDLTYAEMGQFEAWRLRDMTHEEDPWTSTPEGEEITVDSIRRYFEPILRAE